MLELSWLLDSAIALRGATFSGAITCGYRHKFCLPTCWSCLLTGLHHYLVHTIAIGTGSLMSHYSTCILNCRLILYHIIEQLSEHAQNNFRTCSCSSWIVGFFSLKLVWLWDAIHSGLIWASDCLQKRQKNTDKQNFSFYIDVTQLWCFIQNFVFW